MYLGARSATSVKRKYEMLHVTQLNDMCGIWSMKDTACGKIPIFGFSMLEISLYDLLLLQNESGNNYKEALWFLGTDTKHIDYCYTAVLYFRVDCCFKKKLLYVALVENDNYGIMMNAKT